VNRLDPRAEYRGGHYVKPSLFGNISGLDLVLYVAIHAASGTPDAFFPHTHYGIFSEVRINGKPVCEMDVYGGYLGEYGIPIGFVSGEDIAVKQARNTLPWVKGVVVDKRREAYTSGEKSRTYLSEGRGQLRLTAAQAVRCASDMKPLRLKGPLFFEAEFRNQPLAVKFNTWGFHQTGAVVSWEADDMIQGFDKFNQLTFFPKRIYPFRRPLLFTSRQYYRIKATYFAPSPKSEGATIMY